MVELPPQEEREKHPESQKVEKPSNERDLGAETKKPDVSLGEDILFVPNINKDNRYILTDLRKEYPELGRIEEFKILKTWQMYFVWLYASPCSEYAKTEMPESSRRNRSVKRAMWDVNKDRLRDGISNQDFDNYLRGNFSEEVNSAIRRMEMFNPNARFKARLMAEKILDDFMYFLNRNPEEITDTDERKKYVDMCVKIHEELPAVIKNVEEGYGVRTVSKKVEIEGMKGRTLMDMAHEREKQNK